MAIDGVETGLKFERILFATNFSPTCSVAQEYALGIALRDSSTLEFTTIVDLALLLPSMPTISEAALEEFQRSSEEQLEWLVEHIDGVKVTTRVLTAFQPSAAIIDEAVNSKADLVVLGTSPNPGQKTMSLGSTAEEVIRNAPCPILTIGPKVGLPTEWPISFRSIIFATDFSLQAAKAASLALSLACTSHARIYLCHVTNKADATIQSDRINLEALRSLVGSASKELCLPTIVVEHGKALKEILDLAERVNAELIVVGARQSSFWMEYIRQGLTPALLAAAKCPVLTAD